MSIHKIKEAIKSARRSLQANKLRTFLTMLGVIIGVFAVVALTSLVKGLENYIVAQFDAIGSNLIIVASGQIGGKKPTSAFTRQTLEVKHVGMLEGALDGDIVGITPSIRLTGRVKFKGKSELYAVKGTNAEAPELFNITLVQGRYFNELEVKGNSRVIVLGPDATKELFGTSNPLGKTVHLNKKSFIVIGTAEGGAVTLNNKVYIPYTTAEKVFGIDHVTNIVLRARSADEIDTMIHKAEIALARELEPNDFSVISQKDMLSSVDKILKIIELLLVTIAGISLIVGGIGIMNIMLVTVNERTKEVGLRKALGATSLDIGTQFLIEAMAISLVGGLMGLSLAGMATWASQKYLNAEITGWSVILALGFSILVGVVFGTYPALEASKKDPIEALRSGA